jgi:hypothetical protein
MRRIGGLDRCHRLSSLSFSPSLSLSDALVVVLLVGLLSLSLLHVLVVHRCQLAVRRRDVLAARVCDAVLPSRGARDRSPKAGRQARVRGRLVAAAPRGYRLPCRQPSQFRSVHNSQAAFEHPLTRVGRGVGQTLGGHRSAPAAICIALHQPRPNDHFGKANSVAGAQGPMVGGRTNVCIV